MTEDRDRDEMQRLLAYANFSKVAAAVGVKRAAVANWAAGKHVTPGRLEQVRELLGIQKDTPPAEADGVLDEFFERWRTAEAPEWAETLTQRIIAEIGRDREAAMLAMARHLAGMTYEQLQELQRRLLAESTREDEDQ